MEEKEPIEYNPTRAEYTDLALQMEIEVAEEYRAKRIPMDIDRFIKSLIQIRKVANQLDFSDDLELNEFRLASKKRKKPGIRKGSVRLTKQEVVFRAFRLDYPTSKDYLVYCEWCEKNEIPEVHQYSSQDSFRDRLKREKKGA